MRILYCYPFYGELGWEIMNWAPHIRYICNSEGPFDHRFAVVRAGREGLYNGLIDEFDVFCEHEDCTEGNAFVLHRPDAYEYYNAHCSRCAEQILKLEQRGHMVTSIRLPPKEYRYFRYKMRNRLFCVLNPKSERLDYWRNIVDSSALVFSLRWITRSTKKNTPKHLYRAAAEWAEKHGRQFITVGKCDLPIDFEQRGLWLINNTTLDDLLAIYHLCGMVVGSSSGTMHLAALTKTPHVVWGGGRNDVRARYLKDWNPFNTLVYHLDNKFDVTDKVLRLALLSVSDNVASNSSVRKVSSCRS